MQTAMDRYAGRLSELARAKDMQAALIHERDAIRSSTQECGQQRREQRVLETKGIILEQIHNNVNDCIDVLVDPQT